MRLARIVLALCVLAASPAFAAGDPLRGHTLHLFAVDDPSPDWIVQDDVASAEKVVDANGHDVLRIHLKPDAAQRMQALTAAHIGKPVRLTWDGHAVSDMVVRGAFGERFDVPAPPG